jgi:membrane fusion protein (multidrug efflux system)
MLAEVGDAILVPNIAVIPGVNDKNVFVLAGGKAVRRAVQTGTRSEESVQITAGLQPGEVVITSGLQQLRPGMAVAVAEPAPAAPSPAAH